MENNSARNFDLIDRELTEKISSFKRYLATKGNCCQVNKCLKPFYPHIEDDEKFTTFSKVDWHRENIRVRGYTGSHFGDVNVCFGCAYMYGNRDYSFHTINRDMILQ